MSKQPNALSWLWLSALVIALDQASKWWALSALQPAGVQHAVIPGFLNWTLAFNTGAAFSFLADSAGWQRCPSSRCRPLRWTVQATVSFRRPTALPARRNLPRVAAIASYRLPDTIFRRRRPRRLSRR